MIRRRFFNNLFLLIAILLLAITVLFVFAANSLPDGRLRLWFLDVGQGDGILARLPAGEWLLIDGGPDASILEHIANIMPFYERDFELVILTHPHADHINGLLYVLERYKVRNILLTGVKCDYSGYVRLFELVKTHNVNLIYTENETDYAIGNTAIDMIYPGSNLREKSMENINNSSIVFRLIHGKWRGLFSGDLEKEGELFILTEKNKRLDLSANLFKAGHHGSKTSNLPEFLRAIAPQKAVISCGSGNKFNHPSPKTIETFKKYGIKIHRTDLEGTIEIVVP